MRSSFCMWRAPADGRWASFHQQLSAPDAVRLRKVKRRRVFGDLRDRPVDQAELRQGGSRRGRQWQLTIAFTSSPLLPYLALMLIIASLHGPTPRYTPYVRQTLPGSGLDPALRSAEADAGVRASAAHWGFPRVAVPHRLGRCTGGLAASGAGRAESPSLRAAPPRISLKRNSARVMVWWSSGRWSRGCAEAPD